MEPAALASPSRYARDGHIFAKAHDEIGRRHYEDFLATTAFTSRQLAQHRFPRCASPGKAAVMGRQRTKGEAVGINTA